ncbi:MAG: GDP-mannose 4,6-dehydratase [Bacillaceae bacterium]|nr:GDP-mannose 4,6-dehydratase [Bacillaceae bacterium]
MRALVTGAAGFVGNYLIDQLLSEGYEVVATARSIKGVQGYKQVAWETMDITNKEDIEDVISKWKPDYTFHLAAAAVTTLPTRELYYNTNVIGTYNLLDTIKKIIPNSRTIVVSSASVYGHVPSEQLPIRESLSVNPYNHYAASKASAELVVQAFLADGLDVIIARAFNHTGPGQTIDYVCSKFAKQFAHIVVNQKEPTIEVGNIRVSRDFTDVRDVVRAYERLMRFGRVGEIYNVCSGQPTKLKEIIGWLKDYAEVQVKVNSLSQNMRNQDSSVVFGSNEKIFQHTGWVAKTPLEETIFDLYKYWESKCEAEGL